MKPDPGLAAASFTSVVLVLTALAAATANVPAGLPVAVVSRSALPPGTLCELQRLVIVRIQANRELYINSEPVTYAGLARRLDEIFRTRAVRVAFILGAPELGYGEVAEVIGIVRGSVQNVGLLTPSAIPTMGEPLLQGPSSVRARWD